MHVHVCYKLSMRTTIELPDSLRARLVELAARRGEKGFSRLVQEAVSRYLAELEDREEIVNRAMETLGTVSAEEADQMHDAVRTLRGRWR